MQGGSALEKRARRAKSASLKRPALAPLIDPARDTRGFSRRGGRVFCEEVDLEQVAAHAGTPAYVYSAAAISAAYRELDSAVGRLPHTICYAVKANSNLSILRLLARLGAGFDIVSGGELYRLRRAGINGEPRRFFRSRKIARGNSRSLARPHSPVQRRVGSRAGPARRGGFPPALARARRRPRES